MLNLTLKPGCLSLNQLRQVSRSPINLSLDASAIPAIEESTQVVERVIAEDRTVYGINTGFGLLANTRIAPEDLSRGYSGIRLNVIQMLIDLVNAQVYPCVPQKGSVGASGDLAPLAHMSTVLLGEGQARHNGKIISGLEALKIAGLEPITLAPKEGLALLNGTQASTAFALEGLFIAGPIVIYWTPIVKLASHTATVKRCKTLIRCVASHK